jgi:hypothetical protein
VTEAGKEIRVPTTMDLTQFPTVGNFATTGHKLQGKSVNELVVAEWSKVKNWAYVVLQESEHWLASSWRNRFHPIYRLQSHPDYLEMMERLRNNILFKPIGTMDLE